VSSTIKSVSEMTVLVLDIDLPTGGKPGQVIVAPVIGGIIPVNRPGQVNVTVRGLTADDESFIRAKTEELTVEILPRFIVRMVQIGLR
jgi:hypothetical protein